MIKLLFVLDQLNIGGPQKSLVALLDNIDYDVFDVSVMLLKPEGLLIDHLNPKARMLKSDPLITAATLPVNRTARHLLTFLKTGNISMFLSASVSIIKHLVFKKYMNIERQKLWKKYRDRLPKLEGEYDLAFGYSPVIPTYYVVDCVRAKHKYHWVRGDYRIMGLDKAIEKEYFRQLDGSMAVSKMCADIFVREFSFMAGRTTPFYNFLPVNFYRRLEFDESLMPVKEGWTSLLTVCRLDPLKGLDLALDAGELLVARGRKIKWYIMGGGEERSKVEKLIEEKGLEDHFILMGFQLNTFAYIEKCDIFVHPSRTEGKSNAVDEAKYIGKPIIATAYPTVSEQVEHEVTGLVCDINTDELASAIERLLDDSVLARRLAENCRGSTDASVELTHDLIALCG